MELFVDLVVKLLPLYLLILLGYLSGKHFDISKETLSNLLIFIIAPVVILNGLINSEIDAGTLSIPAVFLFISCFVATVAYYLARFIWRDSTKNALAFIAGSSNSGFFGLPVAVAVFGPSSLGIVASAILGTSLYLTTLGYFIASKGKYSSRDSLIRVLKMPVLYAFIIGVIANVAGLSLNPTYQELADNFNGAMIVLGMMLVGLGMSEISKIEIDSKFLSFTFFSKFILWPAVTLTIILLDRLLFGIYDEFTQKVLIMMSLVPVAGNVVGYSTILNLHPKKSAMSVFLTSIFAIILIPIVVVLFF